MYERINSRETRLWKFKTSCEDSHLKMDSLDLNCRKDKLCEAFKSHFGLLVLISLSYYALVLTKRTESRIQPNEGSGKCVHATNIQT